MARLLPYALLAPLALLAPACGPDEGVPADGGFFGPVVPAIYVLDFGEVPVGKEGRVHTIVRATTKAVLVSPPEVTAPFSSDLQVSERVEPGGELRVEFIFRPTSPGDFEQEVRLRASGGSATYRLRGIATPGAEECKEEPRTDLHANVRPQVDVLLVMDDHASMDAFREKVVEQMLALPTWLDEEAVDWRLAVTTSGVGGGCLGGTLVGGKVLSRDSTDTAEALDDMLHTPVCTGSSGRGLEASVAALGAAGDVFARREAGLKLIVASTRDDKSFESVVSYSRSHWLARGDDRQRVSMLAIVGADAGRCLGTEPGTRYAEAVSLLNGARKSLCDEDLGIANFFPPASAFGMPRTYRLERVPKDQDADGKITEADGEIEVRVDGTLVESWPAGGSKAWDYDPVENAVVFTATHVPQPGQNIELRYRTSCD